MSEDLKLPVSNLSLQHRAALKELQKRQGKQALIRASLFDKQLEYLDDRSPLRTIQCDRRAGKSYSLGAEHLIVALDNPETNQLYVGPTAAQAERIMLKDVYKTINRKYELGMKVDHTDLICKLPNDSVIYILGMDSSPEQLEKAFGQKFIRVAIDEAAIWKQDVKHLVHTILEPACVDLDGLITMASQPVSSIHSYFFEVTYYDAMADRYVPEWSRHKWSWRDNPHIREKMQKLVDRKIALNPHIVETTGFRNMYMNQWVVDLGSRVYKYDPDRNGVDRMPDGVDFAYNIGVDLGYAEHGTAFSVWGFHHEHPHLYLARSFKRDSLDITAVAEILWSLVDRYNPIRIVIDGAAKQAVEEMKKRHGLNMLEAAEKPGKSDIIELMNADYQTGRIKIVKPECQDLINEYESLVWDHKSAVRVEHPGKPNHCADSALYPWRKCFHSSNLSMRQTRPLSEEEQLEKWAMEKAQQLQGVGRKKDFATKDFGKRYGFH